MKRNQSGFTLIEIAIVLVIIGLLLGGVLKGQELINSAKVKNLANDFKNIPVFIYGYQDKYRALPGDDAKADTHVKGGDVATTNGTPGNGVIDGNWNSTLKSDETYLFWQHVRLANLAPGSTDLDAIDDYFPTNAIGGKIGIQSGSATDAIFTDELMPGSYVICSAGILGKFVKQLDIRMDDGNTASGSMMAGKAVGVGDPMTAELTIDIDDAVTYTVCMGV